MNLQFESNCKVNLCQIELDRNVTKTQIVIQICEISLAGSSTSAALVATLGECRICDRLGRCVLKTYQLPGSKIVIGTIHRLQNGFILNKKVL